MRDERHVGQRLPPRLHRRGRHTDKTEKDDAKQRERCNVHARHDGGCVHGCCIGCHFAVMMNEYVELDTRTNLTLDLASLYV
jgi:hypothetical protein